MNFAELSLEMQRRLFGVSVDDLRRMITDSRNELADLRVIMNRLERDIAGLRTAMEGGRDGAAERLIEDMSLDEILSLHTGCHEALERFEIHGAGPRTLRDAAETAGAELLTIVATVKNLLKDKAA